jgi:hypothetical protein
MNIDVLSLPTDPIMSRIPSIKYWPQNGQLIAGSFVASMVTSGRLPYNDVDIHFRSIAADVNYLFIGMV